SIRNSNCPALTSLPSRKTRFWTMPGTRARTSAIRVGSSRPGSSLETVVDFGSATTTATGAGGGALPPAGWTAEGSWPQPVATNRVSNAATTTRAVEVETGIGESGSEDFHYCTE